MSSESQLKSLLNALAVSYPLRLSEESLQTNFGEIASALAKIKVLQRVDHVTEAECPGPSACLKTFTHHNSKFYMNCDCEEGMGLIEVQKERITRFEVALKPLLDWMAKELNLSGGVHPVPEEDKEGISWSLGKSPGRKSASHYYFCRTISPAQAQKFAREVQKENPRILWLGEPPHTGIFPKNIIPLADVLEPRNTTLFLNRRHLSTLPAPRHTAGANTILLGKTMGMEKQGEATYLLFDRQGDTFKRQERIRPQAYRMIRFLHDVRKRKEHSFNLGTFVERGFVNSNRTASDRIREINDLCDVMNAEPVFDKFSDDKWGLNPALGENY